MSQERLWMDCDFLLWKIGSSISFSELKAHVDACECCRKIWNTAYKYDYKGPYEYDDWNDSGGTGGCEVVNVIPQGLNREDFLYYWHLAECKKWEIHELVADNLLQRFYSEDAFWLVKSLCERQANALCLLVSDAPEPLLEAEFDIIVKRYKELKSFLGANEFFEFFGLSGRETDLEKIINAWRLILLGKNDPEISK